MKNIIIAVDGPAGAGKSTIAKIIAKELNINYIDTGAMYRAVTLKCLQNNIDVTKIKEVRYLMVDLQREIGKNNAVILDGRDIGSYVFPNADYKFFLVATPEERGKRRYIELKEKGYEGTLEDIINDIIRRDEIDSNREFAPLVKAEGAIEIDTTGKDINQVVELVLQKIK